MQEATRKSGLQAIWLSPIFKCPLPLALLSFSPSCYPGTRHVEENACPVAQEAVMLKEMPVMLLRKPSCRKKCPSCYTFHRHVMFLAVMLTRTSPFRGFQRSLIPLSG